MTGQSPWSVKGVQPRTREAAKDLARREGLTLGEWLNRLIGEVDEEIETPARMLGSGADLGAHAAHMQPFPQEPVSTPPGWVARDVEASRLSSALEQLTRRLDMAGMSMAPASDAFYQAPPHPANMSAPDNQGRILNSFAERVEQAERLSETAIGRVDATLSEIRQTQSALSERLRRVEDGDPNHKSLAALRGLEALLGRLSEQAQANEERLNQIENVTQEAIETVDTSLGLVSKRLESTEALAQSTNERFADAMIDLSARLTGLENPDSGEDTNASQFNVLDQRIQQIEDITTQAVQGIDRGMGLVADRVSGAETMARETNERLVEALVELSARLTELEANQGEAPTKALVAALEAKTSDISKQMEALTGTLESARADLDHQIKSGLTTNIDSKVAEIASALAQRLDSSEQRYSGSFEKLGSQLAQVSQSLDQRMRAVEGRGGQNDQFAHALRAELAKMGQAVEERLGNVEKREAAALSQTGQHLQSLSASLNERIDASDRKTAQSIGQVSSQMQQLAERLEARQNDADRNLEQRLGQVSREIQGAEDRAKAVSAPLHREFDSVVERLNQLETRQVDPYAETISQEMSMQGSARDGMDSAVVYDPARDMKREAFGSPMPTLMNNTGPADFDFNRSVAEPVLANTFASPHGTATEAKTSWDMGAAFPDAAASDPSGLTHGATTGFAAPSFNMNEAGFSGTDEDPFALDPARSANGAAMPFDSGDNSDGLSNLETDFEDEWGDKPSPRSRPSSDYLMSARMAANRAAAEHEAATSRGPKAKKTKAAPSANGAAGRMPSAAGRMPRAAAPKIDSFDKKTAADLNKQILSPVGIAAAAAIVATAGMVSYSYLNKAKVDSEKPAALNAVAAPAAAAPSAVTPADATQNSVLINPEAAATGTPTGELSPTFVPPATAAVDGQTPVQAGVPPTATPVAAPSAMPATPQAQAGAKTIPQPPALLPKAQLVPPSQSPIAKPQQKQSALPAVPTASAAPAASATRFAASEAAKARTAIIRSNTERARMLASKAPEQVAPPRIATSTSSRATSTASANTASKPSSAAAPTRVATTTPSRTAAVPKIASSGAPAAAATARSPYELAIARQQAGDTAGSIALMRRAADSGDARALNRLAKMYERGEGVTKDLAQARLLTERAAARGSRQALHNLGVYYADGEGTEQDLSKAAQSFRRAAQKGVTDSQFNLGAMAEQGIGIQKSDRDAYYWYSIAGRAGDRDAVTKAREIAARLPAAERTAEDQRAAQFRPEAGGPD